MYLNLFVVHITFLTYVNNLKVCLSWSWYLMLVQQEVLQTECCLLQVCKWCAFSRCCSSQFDIWGPYSDFAKDSSPLGCDTSIPEVLKNLSSLCVQQCKMKGCAMAQAVSCQPVITKSWVQSQTIPCGVCGGQSGTAIGHTEEWGLIVSALYIIYVHLFFSCWNNSEVKTRG